MLLVIYSLGGRHTDMHTNMHTDDGLHRINFKRPGGIKRLKSVHLSFNNFILAFSIYA